MVQQTTVLLGGCAQLVGRCPFSFEPRTLEIGAGRDTSSGTAPILVLGSWARPDCGRMIGLSPSAVTADTAVDPVSRQLTPERKLKWLGDGEIRPPPLIMLRGGIGGISGSLDVGGGPGLAGVCFDATERP